ncbi:MAG: class I SAM-dependent methyltransferase [Verrucomicrobiota bacterium]|nr:class I SAM-dependent methyltransferase [Verrucomicrobiota bacterium]
MKTYLIPQTIRTKIRWRMRAFRRHTPYLPSFRGHGEYCLTSADTQSDPSSGGRLPVPPRELRVSYGNSEEQYLTSGKEHVDTMVNHLKEGGYDIAEARRILDFGCGDGRMTRHFPDVAPQAECWGTDISSRLIRWCRHNLSPRINFAMTTTTPHLPFPDGHFDLVVGGSIFTHIEDLEQAWLLELARITAPGGRLYITIHDESTLEILQTQRQDHWLAKVLFSSGSWKKHGDKFQMMVLGRGDGCQVFYKIDYFLSLLPPCYEKISHFPKAYGYQSAVVLKRR